MKKIELKDLQELYRKVILPFHTIDRDLTLSLPSHRPDNDAEHSWSLALMALALAPEIDPDLDVGKVAIYSIIHDIVEIHAGDTSVWASAEHLATKKEREQYALEKIKKELPQFNHLTKNIEDYEDKKDNEAKFVYALDKFIGLLTITEDKGFYYKKNKITQDRYLEQLTGHRQKAHASKIIGQYYDQLREEFDHHPEHFYAS